MMNIEDQVLTGACMFLLECLQLERQLVPDWILLQKPRNFLLLQPRPNLLLSFLILMAQQDLFLLAPVMDTLMATRNKERQAGAEAEVSTPLEIRDLSLRLEIREN